MTPNPTARDPVRSLFGIALALTVATALLRDIHGVQLGYDLLAFVWFASLFVTAIGVLAAIVETARSSGARSLYFAIILLSGQLLGFREEMDKSVVALSAVSLWILLAILVAVEAWSLRPPPSDEDES